MTNEEIFEIINELNEEVAKIPGEKLTGKERQRKHILNMRVDLLQKILEARLKYRTHKEYELTMLYGAVTSFGEKYPFLIPFIKAKGGIGL